MPFDTSNVFRYENMVSYKMLKYFSLLNIDIDLLFFYILLITYSSLIMLNLLQLYKVVINLLQRQVFFIIYITIKL